MDTAAAFDPSHEAIAATATLIAPYLRLTPVVAAAGADFGLRDFHLVFKLELLQHAGSFKPRGAFASLLSRPIPAAGVAAASGGNHGAAVAYAARQLGVPANIFVPRIASPAKLARIRGYGAALALGGEDYAAAAAACDVWVARSGALSVHAYDQPETILGQATVGYELARQAPELDTLLVAVGGGGLIGGTAAWYRGGVRLVGVESERTPTLARALAAGRPVEVTIGGLAADSLGARSVGALMFPLAQRYVDCVVLVSDEAIFEAQQKLWESLRIVAEPGGAAAFAALLAGAYRPRSGERVGVLVCGGNTTAVAFAPP